jgi:hypothetical protein
MWKERKIKFKKKASLFRSAGKFDDKKIFFFFSFFSESMKNRFYVCSKFTSLKKQLERISINSHIVVVHSLHLLMVNDSMYSIWSFFTYFYSIVNILSKNLLIWYTLYHVPEWKSREIEENWENKLKVFKDNVKWNVEKKV